jgi:hypothetical protein
VRWAHPPVEVRNQARVHLWYADYFGQPYTALGSAGEGIDRFASKTHSVGVRLDHDDRLVLYTPFGLADLFAFRIVPNPVINAQTTCEEKAARHASVWPELSVVPWPGGGA